MPKPIDHNTLFYGDNLAILRENCTARQGPAANLPKEAGKWLGM